MWFLLSCATPPPEPQPLAAPEPPSRPERVRDATLRAVRWIDEGTRDPEVHVTLDLLIGLAAIGRTWTDGAVQGQLERLKPRLDSGTDPRRRLWDPAHRMPDGYTPQWQPTPGSKAGPNYVLVEALYCAEHGFRPAVLDFACTEMRDEGGYLSAHAAWGIALAVDNGCLPRGDTCLDALRDELVAAATATRPLPATLDRDLLAEQVLFGLGAGARPDQLDAAVDALLDAQAPSGAMGVAAEDEPPWWGIHATLAAAWAWSAWAAAQQPSVSTVRPLDPAAPEPPPPLPPEPSE